MTEALYKRRKHNSDDDGETVAVDFNRNTSPQKVARSHSKASLNNQTSNLSFLKTQLSHLQTKFQSDQLTDILYLKNVAPLIQSPRFEAVSAISQLSFQRLKKIYETEMKAMTGLNHSSHATNKRSSTHLSYEFQHQPDGGAQFLLVSAYGATHFISQFLFEFDADVSLNDQRVEMIEWETHKTHLNLENSSFGRQSDIYLTPREIDVLKWVAHGKSNSDIARILGISIHTVNAYTKALYLKTNTHDRVTLSLLALQNQFFEAPQGAVSDPVTGQ